MADKKQTLKRILIYVLLAYLPLFIAVLVLNSVLGGRIFEGELAGSAKVTLFSSLAMLCPAVASILTRLITKEGFRNTYLRANFKGNMRFYVLALFLPLAYGLIGALFIRAANGAIEGVDYQYIELISGIAVQLEASVLLAFYALGEELGWRGYLTPKLEELVGTPAATLICGIMWGLWHAPLTCSGHNFGTSYSGFPFVWIALMCLYCVLMSFILTYLTKRTRSVYPAAILHSSNNNVASIFVALLAMPNDNAVVRTFLLSAIPVAAISLVAFFLMLRKYKTTASI